MDSDEQQLDRVFAAYREACPDPDPTKSFMPGIWSRIEARRGFVLRVRRWTSAFVTAAAIACVAMAFYMPAGGQSDSPVDVTTYVETLEENPTFETVAYADVVVYDLPEGLEIR